MHNEPVIVNNTPLVALWTLQRLDLLQILYGEVLVPAAVHAEFLATERKLRQAILASATWIHSTELADPRRADTFVGIGHGEAEVLVLAQERHARLVIIDDLRARRFAKRLEIPLTGTLGVLLLAKSRAIVTAIYPMIQDLQRAGIFLSPSVVQTILKMNNPQIQSILNNPFMLHPITNHQSPITRIFHHARTLPHWRFRTDPRSRLGEFGRSDRVEAGDAGRRRRSTPGAAPEDSVRVWRAGL